MKTKERKRPAPAPVVKPAPKNVQKSLLQMLLGFLGVSAAIVLLPRLSRLMARRIATDLLTEAVGVIVIGLLTERMADRITHIGSNGKLPT